MVIKILLQMRIELVVAKYPLTLQTAVGGRRKAFTARILIRTGTAAHGAQLISTSTCNQRMDMQMLELDTYFCDKCLGVIQF